MTTTTQSTQSTPKFNIKRTKLNFTENESININTTSITVPKLDKKTKRLSAAILDTVNKSTFFIETPSLYVPFGVSGFGDSEELKSWSLALKLQGQAQSEDEITNFEKYLNEVDNMAIDHCVKHSQIIFKKVLTREQVELKFKRSTKQSSKDGVAYPSLISMKIAKDEVGSPRLNVFNDKKELLVIKTMDELQNTIPKGLLVKVMFKLNIYFVNGNAGINMKLYHVMLPTVNKYSTPNGVFVFSDSTEASITSSEGAVAETVATVVKADTSSAEEIVADSSEEDDDDEDEDEEN